MVIGLIVRYPHPSLMILARDYRIDYLYKSPNKNGIIEYPLMKDP
jgi:hypothetical protein